MANGKKTLLTDELKQRVVEAYQAGVKRTDIQKQFDISNGSVNNIIKAAGIPNRRETGTYADITGMLFGRWKALKPTEKPDTRTGKGFYWLCECQGPADNFCGVIRAVEAGTLKNGTSTSCGCYHKEVARTQLAKVPISRITHHKTDTPEWVVWKSMVGRCYNPNNKDYADWGGRGIGVCEEWRTDAKSFLDYLEATIGNKPSDNHIIDRIDNEGDYKPGNIKWSTYTESARNRRGLVFITHNGKRQCVSAWAEEARLTGNTLLTTTILYGRYFRYGWNFERALTQPVKKR